MIIFLGDSLTWGQGLYYEEWYKKGISVDIINNSLPSRFPAELLSYEDDLFRRENHFPNLVAKHFNKSYVTKYGNGGSNWDIIEILKTLPNHFNLNSTLIKPIDFGVIQLTDFMRGSEKRLAELEKLNGKTEDNFKIIIDEQLDIIEELLKEHCPHYMFLSYMPDVSERIIERNQQKLLRIYFKGNEFSCFYDLLKIKEFNLTHTIPECLDYHFNIVGHQVIANNIIDKLESLNIFKN